MMSISELDNRIMAILDKDGRAPMSHIAQQLGVSRQAIASRLQRLESEEVILGYYTVFDSGVVGYNWYRVLFRLLNISKKEKVDFIQTLKIHPSVVWLGEVGGRWDVVVNFACESPSRFNTIIEELSVRFGSLVKDVEVLVYVDIFDFSRSYFSIQDAPRKKFFHKMTSGKSVELDNVDKRLIGLLSRQARLDHSALGSLMGVSRNTVRNRIDRLIEQKIILGFRTFLNLRKLGYESNMLFLQINQMDRERETELYMYLQLLPQVTFVVKHIGKWKVGLEIETRSSREFQDILLGIRSEFSDLINDYDTFPLLQDHVIDYFPQGLLSN